MKKVIVFIMFFQVAFFISCIPEVIGGNFEEIYNYLIETTFICICARTFTEWIFTEKKDCKHNKESE